MGGILTRFRRLGFYREIRLEVRSEARAGTPLASELVILAGKRGVRVRRILAQAMFQRVTPREEIADASEGLYFTVEDVENLWEASQELTQEFQVEPGLQHSFPLHIGLGEVKAEGDGLRWLLRVTADLDSPLPGSKPDPHQVVREHKLDWLD